MSSHINYKTNNIWLNYKDIQPEPYKKILAFNQKWRNSDNLEGIRTGFLSNNGFISELWNDQYEEIIRIIEDPTHWKELPEGEC